LHDAIHKRVALQRCGRTVARLVLDLFPEPPGLPDNSATYLEQVDDVYKSDAYHSLSIEGYSVTLELIERMKSGN
jgi:hypothetical protein